MIDLLDFANRAKQRFANIDEKEVINLVSSNSINEKLSLDDVNKKITEHLDYIKDKPELQNFDTVLEKGLRSGFYKIVTRPYLDTSIFPNSFTAIVYFIADIDNHKPIKYEARIGSLINVNAEIQYFTEAKNNEQNLILNFGKDRNEEKILNPDPVSNNYYFKSKSKFFDAMFEQDKVFYVIESELDLTSPKTIKPVKTKWAYIH